MLESQGKTLVKPIYCLIEIHPTPFSFSVLKGLAISLHVGIAQSLSTSQNLTIITLCRLHLTCLQPLPLLVRGGGMVFRSVALALICG